MVFVSPIIVDGSWEEDICAAEASGDVNRVESI